MWPWWHQFVLLEEIVDYQRLPTAVNLSDQKTVRANGKTYLKRSTIGWQLCCQWRDGCTSWENLPPNSLTYSSVVSQESVRIAFLIATLNGLDLMSCDIGNAYLNAKCREKIWFVARAECGPDLQGCVCKLVRALYGLKSSGAAWRAMFSEFVINVMGFKPTRADADVYMRRNLCNGGTPYY